MRLTTNADPYSGETNYFINGDKVDKAAYDAAMAAIPNRLNLADDGECLTGMATTTWPMKSDALAVHPDQVAEANARNKRHGVNVQYSPVSGRAIIPDRAERKKLLRLEKFHDNNAGYGD